MINKRAKYILSLFLLTISIGAIPAGVSMLFDPSGKGLGMTLDLLNGTPFGNFFIPGLFLVFILGLLPILIIFGLLTGTKNPTLNSLNFFKRIHWSLTYSLYLGILLIIWLNLQILWGIPFHFLHLLYNAIGFGILIIIYFYSDLNENRS